MEKTRTITVKGRGTLTIPPDTTVVILHLQKILPTYEMAIKASAEDLSKIKDILSEIIDRKELKTTSFSVDQAKESYRDKNGNYKQKLIGYRYDQVLKFSFPNDNEKLGKVLYLLSKHETNAEVDFEFTVSDTESVKNKLIAAAVADAKEKANVLAMAAGVTLGEIVNIDYSWAEVHFSNRSIERLDACFASAPNIDVTPDDVQASDTVSVIWEIK